MRDYVSPIQRVPPLYKPTTWKSGVVNGIGAISFVGLIIIIIGVA